MDQQQQQPARPEDLVRRLKAWGGLAIAGLLGIGTIGGVLAIHYAGQVTQAQKNVSYQKADDSWIDHEPNRVAHADASAASASSSPTPQASATPMPQYQPPTQNYVPPTMPNPAVEHRRQEYEKALASDLLIAPRAQSQVLETPRLVSAGGEPVEGQNSDVSHSGGPIVADPHPASPYTITTG